MASRGTLRANGLAFCTYDLSRCDYELARQRREILEDMKPRFEAEKMMFIWDNRFGECNGIIRAVEEGLHARYLYHASLSAPAQKAG